MKAISLWQPFASLIADGHKKIETRSWETPYRGPIAIHAAKRWTKEMQEWLATWPLGAWYRSDQQLPLGAVVAIAELWDCRQVTPAINRRAKALETDALRRGQLHEVLYGDYTTGRWMWRLRNVVSVRPYAVPGRQGLFEIDLPGAGSRLTVIGEGQQAIPGQASE